MAYEQGRPLDIEAHRDEFLRQSSRFRHFPFLSRLEEPADRVFVTTFKDPQGTEVGQVRFRKWKHGEIGYLLKLPFYHKILLGTKLTEEEQATFDVLKSELVKLAILDKNRWSKFQDDPRFIDIMFANIQFHSNMDLPYAEAQNEFLGSDLGFMYGYIWLVLLHKTPSQVAELTESDVAFVNEWANIWFDRLRREK